MLQNEKIQLRPLELEDIETLSELRKKGNVLYHLSSWLPVNDPLAAQENFFGEKLKKGRTNEPQFGICLPDGTLIGTTGLIMTDFRNAYGLVHIFIGADYTSKGYGTEAMKLLVAFLFQEMNLERIALNVFGFNERAIKSYKKAGFVEEGRLRQHLYRGGQYHDFVQMAILKEEWLEGK